QPDWVNHWPRTSFRQPVAVQGAVIPSREEPLTARWKPGSTWGRRGTSTLRKGDRQMTTKIAISSFSFLGFGGGPDGTWVRSIPHLIDLCAGYGVDGIEMLVQHLEAGGYGTPGKLAELQQYAAIRGI